MVNDIARGGLIVAQASQTTALLDELIALCNWPLLLRPSVRALLQQIDICRPACLLFWLDSTTEIATTAELVALLRNRGSRPYRITVSHSLDSLVEQTFRSAGVHSYFALNGNLHSLFQEALLPFVELQRTAERFHPAHSADRPVPVRPSHESRASPATMRPP
jgi:hypothetical protein